jgi:cobalt-zinc-cadmium resistance protein CzcA
MFNLIIDASVKFRWFVILIVAAVSSWGIFELTKLPIDAVPDITNRQVQITTIAPSLAPEQIERQVTYPIETALSGIPGLTNTRSISRNGFSQVTAVFTDDTDIYFARNQIGERIGQAKDLLPSGIEPNLSPITTGLGEVFMWTLDFVPPKKEQDIKIGIAGWQNQNDYLTPEGELLTTALQKATYLRTIQEWVIAPHMRTTKNVAGVDTIGGYVKEYSVLPDVAKMQANRISFEDLVYALNSSNTQSGAGFIERGGEAIVVRADSQAISIQDLSNIPISNSNGFTIKVSDIANVTVGYTPRLGAATMNGSEVVIGTTLMLARANSRTVSQDAIKKLNEIQTSLPPFIKANPILNRSDLVNSTIRTVERNLAEGAMLVIFVLFLLLGNARAAIITALMIPFSFLIAVIGMNYFKISGNLMSLGALDFGLLVDGAVVVIESTMLALAKKTNRLRRTLSISERLETATHCAQTMIKPVLFGQLIILLVFAPLLTFEGVEGKMFQPMAATVMLALLGAFILSFTFVPAMTALIVREPKLKDLDKSDGHEHETFILRNLRKIFDPAIIWAVKSPKYILAAAIVFIFIGLGAFSKLGREFIPKLDEGNIAFAALRVPSVSLNQSLIMQQNLERAILSIPEVQKVWGKTGTGEAATDPMPVNITDSIIILKDRKDWPNPNIEKHEIIERMEEIASKQLGQIYEFSQPVELRFNELISGVRTDLAVKVYGDDFNTLNEVASQISVILNGVKGAADVRVEQTSGLPTLTTQVDRIAASGFGISPSEVTDAVSIGIGGREAGHIFEGDKRFNVVVRLGEAERNNLDSLSSLPIISKSGIATNLASVASLDLKDGPNQISRENGSRRVVVSANIRGENLGKFVSEAQRQVSEKIAIPSGVRLEWGGQIENLQRAEARLRVVIPIVAILICLLLFMALGSMQEAAVVFGCVPLALVGGALSLLIRGMPFSISSAVGFIAVSGVATLNGLVLMQSIKERLENGSLPISAVIEGVSSRLRPVLTTALVAIVGFMPMAFAHGAGAEVQKPLATVVIGGLISATILTLIILPSLVASILGIRSKKSPQS